MSDFSMNVTQTGPGFAAMAAEMARVDDKLTRQNMLDLDATMRRRVKVKTSATKNSIMPKQLSATSAQVSVGFGGPYLESGTRFMKPQPFAAPSIAEVEPRALARAEAAVKEITGG